MRPVFADPKTDFVFQRIFRTQDHEAALIGFLNDILDLDEPHRVLSVSFLTPEQRPKVSELKYSIVDVTELIALRDGIKRNRRWS
jgi:hypothetical protein